MAGEQQDEAERADAGKRPLFILSFRHRDELTRLAVEGDWLPIAARRTVGAERRFVMSDAGVAVVDARDALEDAHQGVRTLADAVEANAAALLVLISKEQSEELGSFYNEGATHFLSCPFTANEFIQATLFAERHALRTGGGGRSIRAASRDRRPENVPSWRWRPGSSTVELSPALAREAGFGESEGQRVSLMELLRKLDADGRRTARAAVDRLLATGGSTAFAHAAGGARLAHHVRLDPEGQEVVGRIEALPSQISVLQSRDSLTGVRDAHAARAWLNQQLGDLGDHQPSVVLLLLAVSRFDAINAAFGRATGDSVLQAAARRIERLIEIGRAHV